MCWRRYFLAPDLPVEPHLHIIYFCSMHQILQRSCKTDGVMKCVLCTFPSKTLSYLDRQFLYLLRKLDELQKEMSANEYQNQIYVHSL